MKIIQKHMNIMQKTNENNTKHVNIIHKHLNILHKHMNIIQKHQNHTTRMQITKYL